MYNEQVKISSSDSKHKRSKDKKSSNMLTKVTAVLTANQIAKDIHAESPSLTLRFTESNDHHSPEEYFDWTGRS